MGSVTPASRGSYGNERTRKRVCSPRPRDGAPYVETAEARGRPDRDDRRVAVAIASFETLAAMKRSLARRAPRRSARRPGPRGRADWSGVAFAAASNRTCGFPRRPRTSFTDWHAQAIELLAAEAVDAELGARLVVEMSYPVSARAPVLDAGEEREAGVDVGGDVIELLPGVSVAEVVTAASPRASAAGSAADRASAARASQRASACGTAAVRDND